MVQTILRVTKAESAMNIFNDMIKPLPDTAQALASTLFISVVPIFFIYLLNFIVLAKPSHRDSMIYYLISFAIGGLLGDVFFHTLPHLSAGSGGHNHNDYHHDHGHSHDHSHEHHSHDTASMHTNMIIISGIVCFFLIEKIVANYLGGGGHQHSHSGESHGHTHLAAPTHDGKKNAPSKGGKSEKPVVKEEVSCSNDEKDIRYKSYAIMTLIGDFFHNFTDGLSIGVAYVASKSND
jgi:zinc transporter 7